MKERPSFKNAGYNSVKKRAAHLPQTHCILIRSRTGAI
jgi:hypothetical protein